MGGYDVETAQEPEAVERNSTRISAAIEEWDSRVHRRMSIWSHGDEWLTESSPDPTGAPVHGGIEAKSIEAWVPSRTGDVNFVYVVDEEQEKSAAGSEEIIPPEESRLSRNRVEALFLSTRPWKFVRGQRLAEGGGSCQALGSLRYSPQAQSSASSGAPACSPLGSSESSYPSRLAR
jgi:hypothetical protein